MPHSVYSTLKRQKMPGFCLFLLLHNDDAEFTIKNIFKRRRDSSVKHQITTSLKLVLVSIWFIFDFSFYDVRLQGKCF